MPSSSDVSVKIILRPAVMRAAKSQAHVEDLSLAEYVADLIVDDLIAKKVLARDDVASLLAERELMKQVRENVDNLKVKDDWTEHVTLHVFNRIRDELGELHACAIGDGFAGQVNRRIGALVRRRLKAHDRKVDGKPVMANVSRRANSLIKTYTLLYRTPQEIAQ